jgi:uncharacterized surface protein with fasciclin (FAS1) repeats
MLQHFKNFRLPILLYLIGLTCMNCEDHQERYDDPPWLGGSNIETLEKTGKHNIFLALMEKAGYADPIEKTLFTLFVPSDSAFEKYFEKRGIQSVDDLTEDQAKQLFTLHILNNPRTRYYLIYEYVFSEFQGPDGEYASLFFRKHTRSTSLPYKEIVRYSTSTQEAGTELTLYGLDKLLPLFSDEYMSDVAGAPDGSDYTFMYPGTEWGGLQWHDARVTDQEVRTSSGFIYYIDRVVAPPPSIEEYLKAHQDTFGVFYDIAQRFAEYGNSRINQITNEMEFRKSYRSICDFANEYGPFPSNEFEKKDMFSMFIPLDDVLNQYLDNTVYQYYSSLDSVPEVTLFYILQSHMQQSLQLASKIEKNYFNAFGDVIPIHPATDIVKSFMCSNGIIYGMNKVLESNAFSCVPGPLFYNSNYTQFLHFLIEANVLSALSNPGLKVTLFAPDNDAMDEYGIRYVPDNQNFEILDEDGLWRDMIEDEILSFVQDHFLYTEPGNIPSEGFIEMPSGNHMAIYSNTEFAMGGNIEAGDRVTITGQHESGCNNGMLYYVDHVIKAPKRNIYHYIAQDPDLSDFLDLVTEADLVGVTTDPATLDSVVFLKFTGLSDQWTGFVPTNAALASATIPRDNDDDPDTLVHFIEYHFIQGNAIFDDGKVSGSFSTPVIEAITGEGINYVTLDVANAKNSLVVTDKTGQSVTVPHATANNLVQKGVIHKINSVLYDKQWN